MTQSLWIPVLLPSLNDFVGSDWRKYARAKKKWSMTIGLLIRQQGIKPFSGPVRFFYTFQERDRKRDPSNIASAAIKIIEDALQGMKILPNDSWDYVDGIELEWVVTESVGIFVRMKEIESGK